jgi:hypothetical protein
MDLSREKPTKHFLDARTQHERALLTMPFGQ